MTTSDTSTGAEGQTIADPTGAHAAHSTDTAFFGHPRGLGYLAGTELWERFSFYAMQSLLMLYMTKYLLLPENSGKVVGLATYRGVLENVLRADDRPGAGGADLRPLFGPHSRHSADRRLLGDRVLGRTKTITIGALLMSAGHLTMASEQLFLLALLLLILGGGCFIANLAAQIGGLYHPTDSRRTRAFGIYLMALNVGALAAPLIAGTMGERIGYHWGFGAAGIGMIVGLVTYLAGRSHFPPDRVARGEKRAPLTRAQWVTVGAILLTLLPRILAFAAAQQAYGIMVVWADTEVDRTIGGFEMPVTWILTADGILTIVGVLFANQVWTRLANRGREPGDIRKIGIGNVMIAAAFVIVGLAAAMAQVPIAFWLLFYLVLAFAYAWIDPPSKGIIARYAPQSVNGTMFAMSALAGAFGFFALGYLGRFYEPLGASLYFLLTAAMPMFGAVMMIVFAGPLQRLLETAERAGEGATPMAEPVHA